mmetsp:Transcript_46821/g.150500  ORF Transcript_46821/g.150500 Transcript_46821/m.150500 type:complete len:156 (+) Transcript_46821:52-519(+)|eukprot:CAMPEP_0203866124 /NCGR_PEP_ID=MMETSP0359-20131031/15757_1 /ASSEMBLY_ACC=CAM_ASM_000338 /TAXON_ID=268821 /ORGANISM="Scrippsiella Hangoei, Strain SHTV-5" /LENGTH=155 /DNA_ID=CAMNT_0050784153 /DNA_START=54 /DNA_END=521 /DNA_ORIENTATION=+
MSRDNRGGRMYEKTLQDMQDQAGGAWLQVEGLANHNAAEFGLELPSLDLCGSTAREMCCNWAIVKPILVLVLMLAIMIAVLEATGHLKHLLEQIVVYIALAIFILVALWTTMEIILVKMSQYFASLRADMMNKLGTYHPSNFVPKLPKASRYCHD